MIMRIPDALGFTLDALESVAIPQRKRMVFTGCGTAYHAAALGAWLTCFASKSFPTSSVQALELVGAPWIVDSSCVTLGISHSGITKTTVDALRIARANGSATIGVTHFKERPIHTVCDNTFVVGGQPDLSRCHTKAYVASALAAYLLGLHFINAHVTKLEELRNLPKLASSVILPKKCEEIALNFREFTRMVVVGGGANEFTAHETALKLMESSFIAAQGFELEQAIHGPFVSFDKNTLLIVISPKDRFHSRACDLLRAAKRVGASTFSIITKGDDVLSDYYIEIPEVPEDITPFIAIIPLYLFSYYSSVVRGHNPDLIRYDEQNYWSAREIVFPPGTH